MKTCCWLVMMMMVVCRERDLLSRAVPHEDREQPHLLTPPQVARRHRNRMTCGFLILKIYVATSFIKTNVASSFRRLIHITPSFA